MYAINNVEYGCHVERKKPPIISYKKQTPERICSLEQNYFFRSISSFRPLEQERRARVSFLSLQGGGKRRAPENEVGFNTGRESVWPVTPGVSHLSPLLFLKALTQTQGNVHITIKNAPPITTKALSIRVKNKAEEVKITSYNDKTTTHNDEGTHTKTKALHIVTKAPHIITKAPHRMTKALQIMTNVPHNNGGIAHYKKSSAYNIKGTAYNAKCTACNVKCTAYNERG